MANHISLLEYLQEAPLALSIEYEGTSYQNTTNSRYKASDIANVGRWATFDLTTITQRYTTLLNTPGLIERDLMPTSPPRGVTSEDVIRARIHEYL
jgi:predicted transport protein